MRSIQRILPHAGLTCKHALAGAGLLSERLTLLLLQHLLHPQTFRIHAAGGGLPLLLLLTLLLLLSLLHQLLLMLLLSLHLLLLQQLLLHLLLLQLLLLGIEHGVVVIRHPCLHLHALT